MEKLEFRDAVKMQGKGFYLLHLEYILGRSREVYSENKDCSHFMVEAGKDWRNPNTPIVLVIADPEAEAKYLGSRAGRDKYGERDRTYEELIIENQLLKKAMATHLHDSASAVSTLRSGERNVSYWVKRCIESSENSEDKESYARVVKIGERMIKAVDWLCDYRRVMWKALDRRNPPNNDELREIIKELERL